MNRGLAGARTSGQLHNSAIVGKAYNLKRVRPDFLLSLVFQIETCHSNRAPQALGTKTEGLVKKNDRTGPLRRRLRKQGWPLSASMNRSP